MTDFGTLIEGIALAAVGAFMVFAPDSANRVHEKYPLIRIGGRLGRIFGFGAMIAGSGLTVGWIIENLSLLR